MGFEVLGIAETDNGLIKAGLILEGAAQAVVGLSKIRIQLKGTLQGADGLVEQTLMAKQVPQVVMHVRVIGI